MSLYIPQMSDTPAITIPGLGSNFQALDGSQIVEWGSNENGEYVRWDNGLQICWRILDGTNTDPENAGWHVEEGFVEWTIPASFVGELLVLAVAGSRAWHSGRMTSILDTDAASVRLAPTQSLRTIPYRVLVYQDYNIYVYAFAIGRWK